MKNLLEINKLHTYFKTRRGLIKAVNGVSCTIEEGKTLGLVGESGSGKSQTAMSILQLFEPNQKIYDGEIIFDGKKISDYKRSQMEKIRGNDISMIFQEPMSSLNPVFTVEKQISEVLILHKKMNKKEAAKRVEELLAQVKIPNPHVVAKQYPFELSGGMNQRVMIAMALACEPKLLIADEPTTALDVTIQAQILKLMNELKEKQNTSILFITHDLGVINQMADEVAVMYCGQIVEQSPVDYIFKHDITDYNHPYTVALLNSIPAITSDRNERLDIIPGSVPHPLNLPDGCKFADRCKYASDKCRKEMPELVAVNENQKIRCHFPNRKEREDGEK
ncbi:ABC transporter ATP-binding protein [Anaerococcus hydrogenalis]|uniref:ABC transporter, ATP-binding protein n=2 Tax=Anaerococcus hydrogenalis TaxID=33029 RepID=B6WBG0_9FIRM|nr:ABC transporter ATP-binding protein [Anaerococcus hydrogenalis]EEB35172.1 ABC transporter, ATP-binding protein [Anaerococcus hydrogenalis DSM 7454]MDK7695559.1 ABC transporter ATP-binding protein [Anaerococcus hydrogenalis]MDK7697211.1 ABC transporter ATP-binding protein [Anaerococcus hydrogenalis]MDK7708586.1 ABC transporter ATP-binding protein [Anaerococcus hydrogenalis]PMC80980.1 ABC transporter ATP-binding protein [Anaerococcus hydrogenalis]